VHALFAVVSAVFAVDRAVVEEDPELAARSYACFTAAGVAASVVEVLVTELLS
jgi:hypothetical protein